MANNYVMPKLAMAMNEGTVNEWLAKQGEYVEKGQALMTVETEKVTYDCESPESGYINIVLAEGETVPCETVIAQFCDSEEELATLVADAGEEKPAVATETAAPVAETAQATGPVVAQAAQTGGRIKASPLAKKIARDNGLDLGRVAGTGPGGRIVKRDVVLALERGVTAPLAMGGIAAGSRERARVPMKGMRKTIGDRMLQSLQTTAQLSSAWESDITELLVMRKKFVAREEQLGTRVSVNAFIIKAIATAVKQVPIANACQEGEDIVIYDNINMGIAVSMPGSTEFDSGLMVAVLRNVESMGLVDIDLQMKALIARVRKGEASADDLSGSTITLSSTAGVGPPGLQSTPVLNLPNATLLGPSTPMEKPVVRDGEIVPRTMMPMSMTFDHRILDGEPAARFMKAVHDCLENPELMLA
ncbi:MAG: dihydrolipoamide acetyltransferase family protein [Pseudomonadales bacterium]